jgi:membrane-bound lytic murein transglycosylase A
MIFFRWAILILSLVALSACGGDDEARVKRVPATDLPGFASADFSEAATVFARNCDQLVRQPGPQARPEDWAPLCEASRNLRSEEEARTFFAESFDALLFGDGGKGLATGYYEPVFEGAPQAEGRFTAPILGKPDDLVSVDLGSFREDLKGRRIAGRILNGRLVPFEDRAAIEKDPGEDAEILGYMDPDDLFTLQIQGSGIVDLGGEARRFGYAAQNGHPYHAIGRTLVEEGHLELEDVTMQAIRRWLADAPPEEAARVRATNPSYVYFVDRGPLEDASGPLGTAGAPLTPMVSAAVDRTVTPMGAPIWLSGEDDVLAYSGPLIAQDTGGAIRGAARADLYLGRGAEAGEIAGKLKLQGVIAPLIPKTAPPLGTQTGS